MTRHMKVPLYVLYHSYMSIRPREHLLNDGQLPLQRRNLSSRKSMMSPGLNLRHRHFLGDSPVTIAVSAAM
jgi:hypothetical protein